LEGGGSHPDHGSPRVDILNFSFGSLKTGSLSEARFALAATTVGELALFGGGLNNVPSFSARVDIYNSTSGTWSTATLSEARAFLAATAVGDLALFGGGGQKNSGNSSTRVDFFNSTS